MIHTTILAAETEHSPIVPLWQELVLGSIAFAIIALQAYVFTVLTASYIQGSLSEAH